MSYPNLIFTQVTTSWDFFMYIQSYMGSRTAENIWGKDHAQHYLNKWTESRSNVIYFWNRLDQGNQMKLIRYYLDNKE